MTAKQRLTKIAIDSLLDDVNRVRNYIKIDLEQNTEIDDESKGKLVECLYELNKINNLIK